MNAVKYYSMKAFQYGMFLIPYGYGDFPEEAKKQLWDVAININSGDFVCRDRGYTLTLKRDQRWI